MRSRTPCSGEIGTLAEQAAGQCDGGIGARGARPSPSPVANPSAPAEAFPKSPLDRPPVDEGLDNR